MLLSVQIIPCPEKVFNLYQWHHVITVKHMMIVFKPQDALQGTSANNYPCISPDLKQKREGGEKKKKSMLLAWWLSFAYSN